MLLPNNIIFNVLFKAPKPVDVNELKAGKSYSGWSWRRRGTMKEEKWYTFQSFNVIKRPQKSGIKIIHGVCDPLECCKTPLVTIHSDNENYNFPFQLVLKFYSHL